MKKSNSDPNAVQLSRQRKVVIPAQAGIQRLLAMTPLDSGLRRNDEAMCSA